jgi:hypothetical protein
MTGHRSALVLLPPLDDHVDSTDSAFDEWLRAAGWDADRMELRPPTDHGTLGYQVCAVDACHRVAWGKANQGMCSGCAGAWNNPQPHCHLSIYRYIDSASRACAGHRVDPLKTWSCSPCSLASIPKRRCIIDGAASLIDVNLARRDEGNHPRICRYHIAID